MQKRNVTNLWQAYVIFRLENRVDVWFIYWHYRTHEVTERLSWSCKRVLIKSEFIEAGDALRQTQRTSSYLLSDSNVTEHYRLTKRTWNHVLKEKNWQWWHLWPSLWKPRESLKIEIKIIQVWFKPFISL